MKKIKNILLLELLRYTENKQIKHKQNTTNFCRNLKTNVKKYFRYMKCI